MTWFTKLKLVLEFLIYLVEKLISMKDDGTWKSFQQYQDMKKVSKKLSKSEFEKLMEHLKNQKD